MGQIRYITLLAIALLALFSFVNNTHFVADEICDNAIDDDLDGFIDLNDPDCECPLAEPLSLIPNPSFEDMNCCPQNRSQLDCAVDWIQASEATTDYLHTCGWMGWDNLPPPLPFPDGEGCVGWRNGRPGGGNSSGPVPNWKEYAGACLTGPLQAGKSYRFEFYVGFTTQPNSPNTTIVFFGSTDCYNMPFGVGNPNFGCPTNGQGWMELGSVPISGTFEWQLKEISVTPAVDIHAIAIGPNCTSIVSTLQPYYFFDNLVLASEEAFSFRVTASANPCSENLDFQIPFRDTLEYQWYKEGIALIGETDNILHDPPGEGHYQVRLLGPNSCLITDGYHFDIPVYSSFINHTICNEDTFTFNQQQLSSSGIYSGTLKTADNCDSIVYLDLEIAGEIADTVFATVFEGESWPVGPVSFSIPGEHPVNLTSEMGCDSLVLLVLDFYKIFIPNVFSPNQDGFNDSFTVFSGSQVESIKSMQVFDRWGGLCFSAAGLLPNDLQNGWDGMVDGKPATSGTYAYKVVLGLDGGREKEFIGSFVLMR